MRTRIAVGREQVAREIVAAEPIARRRGAPLSARASWTTTALNVATARRRPGRPVAVVVDPEGRQSPVAAAFLLLRRRGGRTSVTLLGAGFPAPPGRPSARLPAVDDDAADALARGIAGLLGTERGPWSLDLADLPLGDPTARRLAARFPTASLATARTTALVDELDGSGPVVRSRDPRDLERELPALLAEEPDPGARAFLRAAARVHAAAGRLELAVRPGRPGALLSLVDGDECRPWWATPELPGVRTERGAPSAGISVPARAWLPAVDLTRLLGGTSG